MMFEQIIGSYSLLSLSIPAYATKTPTVAKWTALRHLEMKLGGSWARYLDTFLADQAVPSGNPAPKLCPI